MEIPAFDVGWLEGRSYETLSHGAFTAFIDRKNPFADKINNAFPGIGYMPHWWTIHQLRSNDGRKISNYPVSSHIDKGQPDLGLYSEAIVAQGIWFPTEVKQVLKSIKLERGKTIVPPDIYFKKEEGHKIIFNFQARNDFLLDLLERLTLIAKAEDTYGLRNVGFLYPLQQHMFDLPNCTIAIKERKANGITRFEVSMPRV